MSIETNLRKDGIQVLQKLDTLRVNSIARNVAQKLAEGLPELHLNYNELFIRLSRLNMYLAVMPEGMAEANYCYENSSIYFREDVDFTKIDAFSIHECLHFLQEIRDEKHTVIGLGLCKFTEFKTYGMALNEAAVQLMTSKAMKETEESVKYYGIELKTISPNFYPLLCSLVNQMAYITGTYSLYTSSFYGTNQFIEKFSEACGHSTLEKICKALDKLLATEEEIIKLTNKLHDMKVKIHSNDKIVRKIEIAKKQIKALYFQVQNLILVSYFDHLYTQISNLEDIESYRTRLYTFKDYIGTAEGESFFNTYYIQQMDKMEEKRKKLAFDSSITSLVVVKESLWTRLFHSLRNLFSKNLLQQSERK